MSTRRTFWEHAGSLRNHLLFIGGFFALVTIVIFVFFADHAVSYLLLPMRGQELVFLSPLGPFLFKIRVALWLGVCISLPVWLGAIGSFVSETLSTRQKNGVIGFMFVAGALGASALAVSYVWLIPTSLRVLTAMVVPGTTLMITADSYLNFFLLILSTALIIAELPIVLVFFTYIGLVRPSTIKKRRRILYIALLGLLAVVTPTADVATLGMVFVPAVLLTELGLIVATLMHKPAQK